MPYNTKKSLKDADGKPIPQLFDSVNDEFVAWTVDKQENINVANFPESQKERSIEELYFFNATAITTNGIVFGNFLDLSKYKKILVTAKSSLDADVKLHFLVDNGVTTLNWIVDRWVSEGADESIAILTQANKNKTHVLNTKIDLLNVEGYKQMQSYALCTSVPTTGSLTVRVWGVVN